MSADTLIARLRTPLSGMKVSLLTEAADRIEFLEAELARYEWLKRRLLAFDAEWGDPATPVVVFKWPAKARIGVDLDAAIDADIASEAQEPKL